MQRRPRRLKTPVREQALQPSSIPVLELDGRHRQARQWQRNGIGGLWSLDTLLGPHTVQSRASLLVWNGLVAGGVVVGTTYCQDGVGIGGNWHILGPLGEALAAVGRHFIVGGDWNMEPDELVNSGCVSLFGAQIVLQKRR